MIHYFQKELSGFTLLETIVAISVLVTAIVGPFSLASQTINAQALAKDNLIAANFAQEGLELFRNYRSNNILQNSNDNTHWLDGTDACKTGDGCAIDLADISALQTGDLRSCTSVDGCTLYYNDTLGVYMHCPGISSCSKSKFSRKITIERLDETNPSNPPEVVVTATIHWDRGLGNQQYVVSTHLLNW